MKATRIFETILYATDLDAAERFYARVLGLEVVSRFAGRGVALRCGAGVLLIFNPQRTRIADPQVHVPLHGTDGAGHMAFLATAADLDEWRRHLQACEVPIEMEVDWPQGGRSIYFRDPAGNSVELAPPTLWGFGGIVA